MGDQWQQQIMKKKSNDGVQCTPFNFTDGLSWICLVCDCIEE